MAKGKKYTVMIKRKREGKTDYRKRIKYLKSDKPRLVVRPAVNSLTMQIVSFNPSGDKVMLTITSRDLKKIGWDYNTGNIPSSYLTGLLIAKKSKVKDVISDFGLYNPVKGSRLYAAIKGAVDGGLNVPHSPDVFPSEDAITGKIILNFYTSKKGLFSKKDPKEITKKFEEIKKKIMDMQDDRKNTKN